MTAVSDSGRLLEGRLAVVTGGGGGIGRATAVALAQAGSGVVVVDIDLSGAQRTVELVEAAGRGVAVRAVTADVADAAAMEALAADIVAELGVPDIVVNNAGIGMAGPFLDTTVEEWRRLLDVNLWGVLHGCRIFARLMVERGEGGSIVNVASAAAFTPTRVLPAYATSKAAVLMLSECLRAELAEHGIGVTAICPGLINTGITRTSRFVGLSDAEQAQRRQEVAELYRRRNAPPEKVATAIVRAVLHNPAVVPVTVEARGALALSRLSPRLMRRLARLDPVTWRSRRR